MYTVRPPRPCIRVAGRANQCLAFLPDSYNFIMFPAYSKIRHCRIVSNLQMHSQMTESAVDLSLYAHTIVAFWECFCSTLRVCLFHNHGINYSRQQTQSVVGMRLYVSGNCSMLQHRCADMMHATMEF